MLESFGASSMSAIVSVMTLAAIPGWDQYVNFLEWFLNSLANFFNSGGIAIIVFTIIVKTLILPLTIKSIRSSKAMQELAPRIKEIQKKHGSDRQAASQEQMALYQQYGVNPMAGCLPMLVQIPIFFGVYRAILNLSNSEVGHWVDGFLWMDNLKEADPWKILPIAAGLFQWVQSRMMRPANQTVTDPQQQMMNTMMNFMPLTVVVFGWGWSAGPVLYWVIQAIYSVVQQWLITGWGAVGAWFPWLPELPEHRRLGYHPPRDLDSVVVTSGQKPEPKGRFAKFMQAQMDKAQEQQKRQQEARDQAAAEAKAAKREASRPGAPRQSAKREDYQSRVDAATKYRNKNSGEPADATDPTTQTVTVRTTRPKKKRKR